MLAKDDNSPQEEKRKKELVKIEICFYLLRISVLSSKSFEFGLHITSKYFYVQFFLF
jgi:hypothetical protein